MENSAQRTINWSEVCRRNSPPKNTVEDLQEKLFAYTRTEKKEKHSTHKLARGMQGKLSHKN